MKGRIFFGPTSSPNCMLGIIKSGNLKSVLTESTILPSLASTLKSVYEQMDDHYDTLATNIGPVEECERTLRNAFQLKIINHIAPGPFLHHPTSLFHNNQGCSRISTRNWNMLRF